MKFLTLFFFFGLGISYFFSQKVNGGMIAGINLANLSGSDNSETKSLMGLRAGFFIEPAIAKGFSFETDVLFSQKGFKGKAENLVEQRRINYLQVSLLPKYYFVKSFSLAIGPYIAFKLNDQTKFNPNIQTLVPLVAPEINTIDLGFESKLQFYFTEKLFGDIFFSTGFSKLYKDNDSKIYPNAFGFTLGYQF